MQDKTGTDLEMMVTVLGLVYGLVLMAVTFLKTRYTEGLRVDALFMPSASEATRPLNFVVGGLVVGYMVLSFL